MVLSFILAKVCWQDLHGSVIGDRANPVGLTISTRGEVTHAHRLVPQMRGKTSALTAAKIR